MRRVAKEGEGLTEAVGMFRKRRSCGAAGRGMLVIVLAAVMAVAGLAFLQEAGAAEFAEAAESAGAAIISERTEIMSGAGYEIQYNPDLWQQEDLAGYDGLVSREDGSQFTVIAVNAVPSFFLSVFNVAQENGAAGLYHVLEMVVPQYMPEGYAASGGTGTFLELKEGVSYASMNFSHSAGESGGFYILVAQEDKANILIAAQKTDQADAVAVDENVMQMLRSVRIGSPKGI